MGAYDNKLDGALSLYALSGGAHKFKTQFCTPGNADRSRYQRFCDLTLPVHTCDSGPIPTQLGELTVLTLLNLKSNALIGALPLSGSPAQKSNTDFARLGNAARSRYACKTQFK